MTNKQKKTIVKNNVFFKIQSRKEKAMIDEILHSVEKAEEEAAQIIEDAKAKAKKIVADAKDEVSVEEKSNKDSFANEMQSRKAEVAAEEEAKDKAALEKVEDEIAKLENTARSQESQIIDKLSKRLLA